MHIFLWLASCLLAAESALGPDEAINSSVDPMISSTPVESVIPAPTRKIILDSRTGPKEIPVTDNFYTSFATAFGMIFFSEIGDKTFLIAAILAMRNSRTKIFFATSLALTLMTIIAVVAGQIVPALIPQKFTQWIAAVLFFIFGVLMLKEGSEMSSDHLREEYDEVVHEIEGERTFSSENLAALEAQTTEPPTQTTSERLSSKLQKFLGPTFSPIAVQAFSMVFLAEWGDRSQVATIVLAAAQNPWGVALGASSGHAVCSLIAVYLGRALSSCLSMKTVTMAGGLLFIFFGFISIL